MNFGHVWSKYVVKVFAVEYFVVLLFYLNLECGVVCAQLNPQGLVLSQPYPPLGFPHFVTLRRLDNDVLVNQLCHTSQNPTTVDSKLLSTLTYCVVESHQVSDASRGLRRFPVTKVWRTERLLGRGSFGEVHLQSQESDKNGKRALKIIPTRGAKLSLADYQRELTALIEFTKPKVSLMSSYTRHKHSSSVLTIHVVQGCCGICRLLWMVSKRRCHVLGNGIHAFRRFGTQYAGNRKLFYTFWASIIRN